MPSFDIVNKVNEQEVDNAFQQARKEIEQRYDFKGTDTHLEKKDKEQGIQIRSSTEQRLEAAREVLVQKLAKRGVSLRGVKYGAVEQSGKHLLAQQLHDQVGLVRYAPPELALRPMRPLGPDWPRDLALALKASTGASWRVSLSDEAGEPSLLDQEKMAEERVLADVLADPNVRAVMDAFPDSELESFSTRGG